MWNTDNLWVETTVITIFYLLGNIFLGHFEERSPNWRKLAKYVLTLAIVLAVSVYVGRMYAFGLLGIALLPVIYIHGIVLPKKGINGWTGEPKARYYEFRGWSKDIFTARPPKRKAKNR